MSEIGTGGIAIASVFGVVLAGGIGYAIFGKGGGFADRISTRRRSGGTRRRHRTGNRTRKA